MLAATVARPFIAQLLSYNGFLHLRVRARPSPNLRCDFNIRSRNLAESVSLHIPLARFMSATTIDSS